MTQYRVVYEIDIEATSKIEAAIRAYELMIDPQSMAPCLEVIPWQGSRPPADGARGTVIDLNEHHEP
jgi:hypothetical protein